MMNEIRLGLRHMFTSTYYEEALTVELEPSLSL